jgi:predicted nucleotidyltransferase
MDPMDSESTLLKKEASSIEEIEAAIREIAGAIGAEKAILFGSIARGTDSRRSDVDVVFVQETGERFIDRPDEPLRLLWQRLHGRGLDVIVYTPSEFERMRISGNRFVRRILSEGKVLYGA